MTRPVSPWHSPERSRPHPHAAPPDLVLSGGCSSHQTQAPDLIERKVANLKASAGARTGRHGPQHRSAQTTPVGTTAAGLKADGLRYQAIANAYEKVGSAANFYTPHQLQAMALRYEADGSALLRSASTPTKFTTTSGSGSRLAATVRIGRGRRVRDCRSAQAA